jgi:lysophospholipid acyltransferase 1/2
MKKTVDNWHIQSSEWLRRIAYERLPAGKTLGVFFLSAYWHGFYPGYYFTLILAALLVYIGRGVSY